MTMRAAAFLAMFVLSFPIWSDKSLRIVVIDSSTPTEALLDRPGTYLGERFLFDEMHAGNVMARVGVWEAGPGELSIDNFPFTEYVLMISGRVKVTETDGTSYQFSAGDTFVIPKGWKGVWDVQERMKKQIVRVGNFVQ
ncbi:MAG: cupin domain-containing protein [Pseudomonadota bacterium]